MQGNEEEDFEHFEHFEEEQQNDIGFNSNEEDENEENVRAPAFHFPNSNNMANEFHFPNSNNRANEFHFPNSNNRANEFHFPNSNNRANEFHFHMPEHNVFLKNSDENQHRSGSHLQSDDSDDDFGRKLPKKSFDWNADMRKNEFHKPMSDAPEFKHGFNGIRGFREFDGIQDFDNGRRDRFDEDFTHQRPMRQPNPFSRNHKHDSDSSSDDDFPPIHQKAGHNRISHHGGFGGFGAHGGFGRFGMGMGMGRGMDFDDDHDMGSGMHGFNIGPKSEPPRSKPIIAPKNYNFEIKTPEDVILPFYDLE